MKKVTGEIIAGMEECVIQDRDTMIILHTEIIVPRILIDLASRYVKIRTTTEDYLVTEAYEITRDRLRCSQDYSTNRADVQDADMSILRINSVRRTEECATTVVRRIISEVVVNLYVGVFYRIRGVHLL